MSTKIKTMKLVCIWPDQNNSDYRVDQVTDSVEYRPGTFLTKKEVASLCDAKDWKITITGPAQ